MTLYTVYDNRTDMPIVVDETAERCAQVMGVKLNTFYCAVKQTRGKRWSVIKHEQYKRINSESFPNMIRVSRLAKALGVSEYFVCKFCMRQGVSVFKAGKQQIRMISKSDFFNKLGGDIDD